MIRALVTKTLASTVVLLACVAAGCGSGDDAALTCAPNTFRLTGSIDDMSIDVTQPLDRAEFSLIPPADFQSIFGPSFTPTTDTNLHVMWATPILEGNTAATATLQIPTSPFPNDAFCAGEGSTVEVAGTTDKNFTFHLASLTSGPGCATPRRGTLDACANFAK